MIHHACQSQREGCCGSSIESCQVKEISRNAAYDATWLKFILTVLVAGTRLLGPSAALDIGVEKELFLDDHLIASATRIQRQVQPAQKFARNPVIWPEESSGEPEMATLYGSVLRDEQEFKIWYKSGMGVGYADSEDGITWRKPKFDLTMIDGHGSNILFRKKNKTDGPDESPFYYELFGVHRDDREQDASQRYKMGFLDIDWKYKGTNGNPWHKGQRRGLGVAGSPDGIHWKLIDSWASEAIVDGATHWMFDTNLQKFVLYGRTKKVLPEVAAAWQTNAWFRNWFSDRAVARIESPDFVHWNFTRPDTAPVVMTAELEDKPGTEIYSLKVFRYGSGYVGLVQVFQATPEASTLHIELASSRDGIHFMRVGRGTPFIDVGGVGAWDRFNLSIANNDPIAVGDELRFYYGGRLYRHGPEFGPGKRAGRGGGGVGANSKGRVVALGDKFYGGEEGETRRGGEGEE